MCMCIYMCVCTYIYMYICVYVYIHVYMYIYTCIYIYIFVLLGLHPWHKRVSRIGVKLELSLSAYTTATATPILNPLSEAKDQTIEPVSLWILLGFVTTEPQWELLLIIFLYHLFLNSRIPGKYCDMTLSFDRV